MPISKLPAPTTPPPATPIGTVVLYADPKWTSTSQTFSIYDYQCAARQSIAGSKLNDKATWVAFNLPVGTVVTLCAHYVSTYSNIGDLAGCGPTVDLIGTGRLEAVDLSPLGANDQISAFFWRNVDLKAGIIELWEAPNYGGNRTVIFLSDWSQGDIHSLANWYISKRVSSVNWSTFPEGATAVLYSNVNGTGTAYSNIKGWGSTKQLDNFSTVGFNDAMAAFSWKALAPVKEIIAQPNINLTPYIQNANAFTATASGNNNSPSEQQQTIQFHRSEAETVTLEVTDTVTTGTQITYTYSVEMGGLFATATWSLAIQLSFEYTKSTTKTTSKTTTNDITVSQNFNVPAMSHFDASLIVQMAKLPPNTVFSTTATRWYTDPLPNSTLDPANNNWYKRQEKVNFNLSCAIACGTQLDLQTTKLG